MAFTKIIYDLQDFNSFGVWREAMRHVTVTHDARQRAPGTDRLHERYDRCCNSELLHILGIGTSCLLLEAPEFGRCILRYVTLVFTSRERARVRIFFTVANLVLHNKSINIVYYAY